MHNSKTICRCLWFQPLASQPMNVEQMHKKQTMLPRTHEVFRVREKCMGDSWKLKVEMQRCTMPSTSLHQVWQPKSNKVSRHHTKWMLCSWCSESLWHWIHQTFTKNIKPLCAREQYTQWTAGDALNKSIHEKKPSSTPESIPSLILRYKGEK